MIWSRKRCEVEKARGVIRNYYDRLKQVEGFEVFEEGRAPEEAVISMIRHFQRVDNEGWKLRTGTEVRTALERKLAQAETATGKSPRWLFQTGRNILKISADLEKEIAQGNVSIEVASEIAGEG